MERTLKFVLSFVNEEAVLKILADYIKTKLMPKAPGKVMDWLAILVGDVFNSASAAPAVAALKAESVAVSNTGN